MTATTIIDVRVLDTYSGAKFVKDLEDKGHTLVFAVENPHDSTAEDLRSNGIVITNTGKLKSRQFWEAVFDFVEKNNTVTATAGHYNHWALQSVSEERGVPYQFVLNTDTENMFWMH